MALSGGVRWHLWVPTRCPIRHAGEGIVLYWSIVLSLILLALAIFATRGGRWRLIPLFVCGLIFTFGPPIAFGLGYPAVAYQFVVLAILAPTLRATGRGEQLAAPVAVATTGLIYGLATWTALEHHFEYNRLRTLYAYESMEDRLPVPDGTLRTTPLPAAANLHLSELEADALEGSAHSRTRLLGELHEDVVGLFVNSSGFGEARLRRPSDAELSVGDVPPVAQPVPRASPASTPEPPTPAPTAESRLTRLHFESTLDFANLAETGYFKDRRHVAGFRPHRFSKVPGASLKVGVETVDLISLLRHDGPVAYVSADLPRMDELRDASTRPLDRFEAGALKQLRQGEDLLVEEADTRLRMLGSIRSVKQCVQCHGGARGDLLGAFAYTLRKK
jgi:hypothetical protein